MVFCSVRPFRYFIPFYFSSFVFAFSFCFPNLSSLLFFYSSIGSGIGEGLANTGTSTSELSVPAVCNLLEDLGLTVRRCCDADEAVARSRDLQREKQLRCLIIGGDERPPGCGNACNESHLTGNCIRCGRGWGSHSGHNCQNGVRGSWSNGKSSLFNKLSADTIVNTLVDPNSPYAKLNAPLSASRTGVYTAHGPMNEKKRLEFWKLGTIVTDDPKVLLKWVTSLTGWDESKTETDQAESDEEDANKDTVDCAVANATKAHLSSMRIEVEKFESRKAVMVSEDEIGRKELQMKAAEKHMLLEKSVNERVSELEAVEAELSRLALSTGYIPCSKHGCVGPHNGRDAAYAFAWLEIKKDGLETCHIDEGIKLELVKHLHSVKNEKEFLHQMILAAKVVTHVTSPTHKKLLNLCHNWLATYLPHCLAKINRVSFGLLSAEDCKAAIDADPHVPRSRLKLAVPFIGKDVPSKSSEFAHPDVIIGLTILAYRYSGLRKDDYIDVMDSLTSKFVREIGPARDRESNLLHEKWVLASGGAIRGLKETRDGEAWDPAAYESALNNTNKEVVQLKFLQKSNQEQMDKLYSLLRTEPLVIHDYLQKMIFPTHMRSQKKKISASGQAVGGDMLVGRRVGFSGTPSDLLPDELGRCDYETGDDGMMLSTVLDRKVASHEFIKDNWTVDFLLQRIASAENPRFNAFIDTGALITGYSNAEVAKHLLAKGLTWCDGVVFLDDDDKQQVLVRATGRVVRYY